MNFIFLHFLSGVKSVKRNCSLSISLIYITTVFFLILISFLNTAQQTIVYLPYIFHDIFALEISLLNHIKVASSVNMFKNLVLEVWS